MVKEARRRSTDQRGPLGAAQVCIRGVSVNLDSLKDGVPPGLSAGHGAFMAEAAAACLEDRGHKPGVHMRAEGCFDGRMDVTWEPVTEIVRRNHGDLQEATEEGACGIALLVLFEMGGFTVAQRSYKGTGFDYWLGRMGAPLFQKKARLEVSGILSGDQSEIQRRTRQKHAQVARGKGGREAYVAVVEFGGPVTRITRHDADAEQAR